MTLRREDAGRVRAGLCENARRVRAGRRAELPQSAREMS